MIITIIIMIIIVVVMIIIIMIIIIIIYIYAYVLIYTQCNTSLGRWWTIYIYICGCAEQMSRNWAICTYMSIHHITLHHIRSHHITLHQITSHQITSHYITSHQITSHHITSDHITSHHIRSHHIRSHHITSDQITSHHITSHNITSHQITSHHIHFLFIIYIVTPTELVYAISEWCTSNVFFLEDHPTADGYPNFGDLGSWAKEDFLAEFLRKFKCRGFAEGLLVASFFVYLLRFQYLLGLVQSG